jgi:hypothetical protein
MLGLYTKDEMDQAETELPPQTKETPAIPVQAIEEPISTEEAHNIENQLASEDKQYREDLLKYYTNSRKLEQPMTNFFGFPKRLLSGLYNSLNKRREARQKKAEPVMETVENYESIQDQF